ncbi:MAG TPA: hypothetical protein PKA88_22340, partial [Polyangiaceae bacterium]|nr:hypothetical protein [Polyangiaceae bacterium]
TAPRLATPTAPRLAPPTAPCLPRRPRLAFPADRAFPAQLRLARAPSRVDRTEKPAEIRYPPGPQGCYAAEF